MSHKYSLAYLTVPGVTPPEQTYIAARAGYEYVSYRLFHLGVAGEPDIDPTSPQVIRESKQALADTGVKCFDIELMRILRSIQPRDFLPAFEAGAELGARHVISSAWTDVRNDRNYIVETFAEICDLAEPFGLTVNLEFPAFSRLTTLEEVLDILERTGRRNQGVLVDTLYMHFNKAPLMALERVPAEWINFLHICDAEDLAFTKDEMIRIARDARLYPGEGAIDFSSVNYMFPNLPLSIELPHAARMAEFGPEQHARNCIEAARAVFDGGQRRKVHPA
ncbi:sugar phosphate isomerase/epimerase family protein [Tropicimonas isoalkanivorans]|uniref:Sugar phosphate isomerase/epimerase n=1 Tax=Tropicimonas isoalkanivorans TaxID=441112 RepID=A0A1I1HHR0_9RHOB|nr:TIM barrel protein [Tropicimonas isoalkanivorans]SFC20630.1 Sugar phosphate isomerase/epimerase [Tropicimonas isoalkanivorans]